jgi:hypothetical protein
VEKSRVTGWAACWPRFLSHSGFRSASDPTSQPHVTAIERSAARYTCYAQRNGPRRVTPATPSGTVRPHPASLSAWDSRPQPDVTAINRSATRYTCYAQRNGPGSGSSRICPLSLGASNWTCEVNRARPQAVGVGCGDQTAVAVWSSTPNPCKEQSPLPLWLWALDSLASRVRGLTPPGYPPTSLPGLSPIRGSLARTRFAFIRVHSRLESFFEWGRGKG